MKMRVLEYFKTESQDLRPNRASDAYVKMFFIAVDWHCCIDEFAVDFIQAY